MREWLDGSKPTLTLDARFSESTGRLYNKKTGEVQDAHGTKVVLAKSAKHRNGWRVLEAMPTKGGKESKSTKDKVQKNKELIQLSKSQFGHTFTKHGEGATNFLINRARGSGEAQGQFLNNQVAAKFIKENLSKVKKGAVSLPMPKNFPARIIHPDGTFSVPSTIRLVPGGNGVKTAYPEP